MVQRRSAPLVGNVPVLHNLRQGREVRFFELCASQDWECPAEGGGAFGVGLKASPLQDKVTEEYKGLCTANRFAPKTECYRKVHYVLINTNFRAETELRPRYPWVIIHSRRQRVTGARPIRANRGGRMETPTTSTGTWPTWDFPPQHGCDAPLYLWGR